MKILLKNPQSNYLEIISLVDLSNINETFKKFYSLQEPLEAKIFAINESISSNQLSQLKNNLCNIFTLCIYSNNRDTVLAGKS